MWNVLGSCTSEEESIGGSFLVNGLFQVSNEEKSLKTSPHVQASLYNGKIIIAIDRNLLIVHENTLDCQCLNFENEISCFITSKTSDIIICCLSNGNIHGFHTSGTPVFNIFSSESTGGSSQETSFVSIIAFQNEYLILCKSGTVYSLKVADESALTNNINSNSSYSELNSSFLTKISPARLCEEVFSFCCIEINYDSTMIVMSGKDHIFFIADCKSEQIECPDVKKLFCLKNYIIGLTRDGRMLSICPFSKTFCMLQDYCSNDLCDLQIFDEDESHIEIITLSSDSQNGKIMKLRDFPSMKQRAEISLSSTIWLLNLQSSRLNLYFIKGIQSEEGNVQSIEICCITETDPSERFRNLISRGLFTEAEKYANEFGLSLEPVLQAKIRNILKILEQITPDTEMFKINFENLMRVLEQSKDSNFLCSLYTSEIPSRSCSTIFLKFILTKMDTSKFIKETNEINEILLRLETLRLIDPEECISRWQKMLNSDMSIVAMDHFKTDVMQSCLIFARHSSSILNKLNIGLFQKWMAKIPQNVEAFQLIQWMKHFLPCFLQVYPDQMSFLVEWCLKRTHSLQFSSSWPEIGLEFLKNAQEVFKVNFIFSDIRRNYHHNMEKIQSLIFVLEEMTVLKSSYHLTVTLDNYKQSSLQENAMYLLQRVQISNLSRIVNDFITPLLAESGQTPEQTIFEYIGFLCSNKCIGFWQDRAIIAVDLLNNEEIKLQAALMVLKQSPVPWESSILSLVKLASTSSHPLANSIFIEYKTQAIKIIKIKYGWPVDFLDLQQDRIKLVFRILKKMENVKEMINDVKILINSSQDIAHEAYFHLICKLMDINRLEELAELIDEIDKGLESSKTLFESVIDTLVVMADTNHQKNIELYENCLEIVKMLHCRVERDDFNALKYERITKNFQSTFKLRKTFTYDSCITNIESNDKKENMLIRCVDKFTSENEKATIDEIIHNTNFISICLEQKIAHGYTLTLEKINNLFITSNVMDHFLALTEFVGKNEINDCFSLSVTIINQHMKYLENNSTDCFTFHDPLTFPICYDLFVRCLNESDITNQDEIMNVLNWMKIGRACYPFDIIESTRDERMKMYEQLAEKDSQKCSNNKRESFSMFEGVPFELRPSYKNETAINCVTQCVLNGLKLISIMSNEHSLFYCKLREKMSIPDCANQSVKNDFFKSLEALLKMKEYRPVLKMLQYFTAVQEEQNTLIMPSTFVTTMRKKIMKFILSQKEPNYMDAFRVLRAESNREDCLEYLRSSLSNNSQKMAYSNFIEMHNKYLGNAMSVNNERESRLKFYYYAELCKYDQTLRTKINYDTVGIKDLLKDLETRQLSVELVKKLSKDFSWDYQKVMIQQLKICLRNQQLEFEVKHDSLGNEEVIIKSTEEMIRKKCAHYVKEITDVNLLAIEMQAFISEINFYFYEMYLYVLELIKFGKDFTLDLKLYRNILVFLQRLMVVRRRGIDQIEVNAWMKYQPENYVLPGISKYRIPLEPFLEMSDPEELLNSDLLVENFEKFVPLFNLHASFKQTDAEERLEICAFKAVKNSVLERKAKSELNNGNEWNLKPSNNAALLAVLRMVNHIKDKSKRLAIIYFHVNHSLPGSDQVEAAEECLNFAISNESEIQKSPKYGDLVSRIKRKYPVLKTQHLLHVFGLNEERLMQLIEYPHDLITTLYYHESILQSQKKDINKLCKEIASIYSIDLESLQLKLLQKWLVFTRVNGSSESFENDDVNETVYEDFMGASSSECDVETPKEDNVIRAHYILKSWEKNKAMSFLGSELMSNNENSNNQLQVYECFAKLVDNHYNNFVEIIDPTYFQLVKCCYHMKHLGFPMSTNKLKESDKVELLKKIWKTHHNNMKGLETMTFICIGFDIYSPQIWNGILKQMISMKMTSNLSTLIEVLSTKSQLLHLESLKSAWEFIITEPFLKASKDSLNDDESLSKSFVMLQKCPISTFLNFDNLIELCLRLDRPHMAAIFLSFINENERAKFINLFLPFNKIKLHHKIIELEEIGVAPVITNSVCHILDL